MYKSVISALSLISATAFAAQSGDLPSNPPWWPSLQAFEHYDSGRSHVFSQAEFLGSWHQRNIVIEVHSPDGMYPSGYNMSYLDENTAFIQGGSYGGFPNSIGPFVARINPKTLQQVWKTQLRVTDGTGEWNYPGAMAIMNNGFIYVVSGYRIYKVRTEDGYVEKTLVLPYNVQMRSNWPCTPATYFDNDVDNAVNTSYNGINALPDGTIVVKSVYRTAGCAIDGPNALLHCDHSSNVPRSVLISVHPDTLSIIDTVQLQFPAAARPSITRYNGVDYVYLLARTSQPVRFSVRNGFFTEDTSWQPPQVSNDGQQVGGSLIVMNEWIVGATNSVPATGHLTMFAIHQGDASRYFPIQPYKDDPVPSGLAVAFRTAAPKSLQCDANGNPPPDTTTLPGDPAISWAGMSLIADPENGLFYGVETLSRKVAAFRISQSGNIHTVWKETQTTSEWPTLIGPKQHRVWVGTDIPLFQIPGANSNDSVVWRDARHGREIARSRELPTSITQGSAVQPGYGGNIYFPGLEGMLIRLRPIPEALGKGYGPNQP